MKKALSIIFAIVLLCVSLSSAVLSVCAADSDDWVLAEDAKFLTHDGRTYYPLKANYSYSTDYDADWYYGDLEYADSRTEELYGDSSICLYKGYGDIAVDVDLFKNGTYRENLVFVEESYFDEYKAMLQGVASMYLFSSYYDYEGGYYFESEEIEDWSKAVTVNSEELSDEYFFLYTWDSESPYQFECGIIFRDTYENNYYLLRYSDYDNTYFYSDGSFNLYSSQELTVYLLEDEVLIKEITEYVDTMPEDELDWLVAEDEVSTTFAAVFCSIVFGFVPFALMVFAVVMLIKVKDKKYHRPYIVMIAGSLVVLLACAGVFIVLL